MVLGQPDRLEPCEYGLHRSGAAMETVFAGFDAIGLTENHIGQLHRDLLQYSAKDDRHRGEYKKLENHVEAFGTDGESLGIVFEAATPFETPAQMQALVDWTRRTLSAVSY